MLGVFISCTQLLAQNRTVSGTVTDSTGQPLPSVSVRISGSRTGTTTDANGTFSLSVPQTARSLEVSSVGYLTQTLLIPASGTLNIGLRADAGALNEVVVTGITRTRRAQFAGAGTKIDATQIANRPVGSFDQLFQGRVPGVLAITGSGQPGQAANVIIRGQGSITGGTGPLYIVDGIPVESGVFQSLNPNDFESIDILRDASAAALYGSRGSSGVIVVTTKRGQSGKTALTYSGQFGVKQRPDFGIDMMTTSELLEAQRAYGEIVGGGGTVIPGWYYSPSNPLYATLPATSPATDPYSNSQARFDAILDSIGAINTNWRDVFFRDGSFSNHQLTLSGGTGKTRFRSSMGLYNEEGTTYRTDMKRVTFNNTLDYSDDKFTLAVSALLGYSKRNFQQSTTTNSLGNPFLVTSINVPYHNPYGPNGAFMTGTGSKFEATNTLETTFLDMNYNNQLKATLALTGSYKITNEISAGITAGVDFRETQNTNYGSRLAYIRRTSTSITGQAGFQQEGLTRYAEATVRPTVGFRKLIADRHDVEVNLFGEYIRQFSKNFTGTGYGIDPRTPNTPAAITQGNAANQLYSSVTGARSTNALLSGLVTARYTLDNKYTLNASFRRDGSSKLPEDTRWQNFYAVGAIWDITREDFLRSSTVINSLRLKASYGSSGNANNFPRGDYPYQTTYAAGAYQGLVTQVATYPGVADLRWETTYMTNIGIDFGFLRNRISGSINLYDKRTKDLFVQKRPSAVSGFGPLSVNAGELQNKGFEVEVTVEPVRTRDLTWAVFGNVALNRNKVLSLGGESSFEVGTSRITEGLPLGTHYEVKWGGVDAATGAPLYYDANGNLTSNFNNAVAVQEFGTWEAPWKGGFGTSVRFKGFELSTMFSWQRGANKMDNLEYFMENPVGFLAGGYNQANTLVFWQKPGDVASTPSPLYSTNFSSKLLHSADFLRWRDLMIAYTLPKSVTDRVKFISNARFYVQGTNLLIWTKWKGMDPEAGSVNINLSEYPNPRGITAGLDITF